MWRHISLIFNLPFTIGIHHFDHTLYISDSSSWNITWQVKLLLSKKTYTKRYRKSINSHLVTRTNRPIGLVPIVSQSQLGYMTTQCTSLHTNRPNCLHYFLLSENVLNYKNGTKMFYVACRTLLVMLCVVNIILWTLMECLTRLPNSATKYMCFANRRLITARTSCQLSFKPIVVIYSASIVNQLLRCRFPWDVQSVVNYMDVVTSSWSSFKQL